MKLYKGFDKDLKCRDYQFEVGKEYEEEKADICDCGFHACENPLDVFGYYPPANSRYCEVDLDVNDQKSDDSKRVGKHIKINAEIGLPGLIKAGIEYIKDQVDWEHARVSNTGEPVSSDEYRGPVSSDEYRELVSSDEYRGPVSSDSYRKRERCYGCWL